MAFQIVLISFLILLNGVFAMGELALVSARAARLAVLERKGLKGAAAARRLAADPSSFLPTVQLGVTLVGILTGVIGGRRLTEGVARLFANLPWLAPVAGNAALVLVVIVITFLTLVFGELLPKRMALLWPERIAAAFARPLAWLTRLSTPAVWLLDHSSEFLLRLIPGSGRYRPRLTEEELKALLAEGAREGVLEAGEREMIERLLRLADKPVRAIMTPRNEVAWIDRTDPQRAIAARLKALPRSRFLVCDGSVDNVVGVVQAKDLLDRVLEGADWGLDQALRQPMVLPDTVSVLDAMERLKSDLLGLALVLDEYGSFEGLVTEADVLEAIVGDAAETGPAEGQAMTRALTLEGGMAVDEVKERLALPDLPAEGSYHTLGGLILALLRRVPRVGDTIVFAGWRFEVTATEGRRVQTVRVRREPEA